MALIEENNTKWPSGEARSANNRLIRVSWEAVSNTDVDKTTGYEVASGKLPGIIGRKLPLKMIRYAGPGYIDPHNPARRFIYITDLKFCREWSENKDTPRAYRFFLRRVGTNGKKGPWSNGKISYKGKPPGKVRITKYLYNRGYRTITIHWTPRPDDENITEYTIFWRKLNDPKHTFVGDITEWLGRFKHISGDEKENTSEYDSESNISRVDFDKVIAQAKDKPGFTGTATRWGSQIKAVGGAIIGVATYNLIKRPSKALSVGKWFIGPVITPAIIGAYLSTRYGRDRSKTYFNRIVMNFDLHLLDREFRFKREPGDKKSATISVEDMSKDLANGIPYLFGVIAKNDWGSSYKSEAEILIDGSRRYKDIASTKKPIFSIKGLPNGVVALKSAETYKKSEAIREGR